MVTAVGPVANQPQTNSRNKGKDQEGTLVKQKRKYTSKVSKEPLLCSTQEGIISEEEIKPLNVSSACMPKLRKGCDCHNQHWYKIFNSTTRDSPNFLI